MEINESNFYVNSQELFTVYSFFFFFPNMEFQSLDGYMIDDGLNFFTAHFRPIKTLKFIPNFHTPNITLNISDQYFITYI